MIYFYCLSVTGDFYCLWLFFTVPLVGLQCVSVVFHDHTHLHIR